MTSRYDYEQPRGGARTDVRILVVRAAQARYSDGTRHIYNPPPYGALNLPLRQVWEHLARVALVAAFPPLGLPPRLVVSP